MPSGPDPSVARHLLVIGTGLIGTSVGLAARRAGWQVTLTDRDPQQLAVAVAVGAGTAVSQETSAPDLVVCAVPPAAIGPVAVDAMRLYPRATITHVGSVQSRPQLDVEASNGDVSRFVGSHPIAGGERGGAHHASTDLFDERPWLICPGPAAAADRAELVAALAADCGGTVTRMSPQDHDDLLAVLSHAPQLVASALAGLVVDLPQPLAALSGTGLRDTTRLADSDPLLWGAIIAANPAPVAAALRRLLGAVQLLVDVLDDEDPAAVAAQVTTVMAQGARGRAALGGKHGRAPVGWATVTVVVPDEPGRLSQLFATADAAKVNIEDVRVDHAVGQPLGLVDLDVAREHRSTLHQALAASGWSVTSSPPPA